MDGKSCCAPSGDRENEPVEVPDLGLSPEAGSKEGMVELEGGSFLNRLSSRWKSSPRVIETG